MTSRRFFSQIGKVSLITPEWWPASVVLRLAELRTSRQSNQCSRCRAIYIYHIRRRFLKRGKETRSFKDVMNCPPFFTPDGRIWET